MFITWSCLCWSLFDAELLFDGGGGSKGAAGHHFFPGAGEATGVDLEEEENLPTPDIPPIIAVLMLQASVNRSVDSAVLTSGTAYSLWMHPLSVNNIVEIALFTGFYIKSTLNHIFNIIAFCLFVFLRIPDKGS